MVLSRGGKHCALEYQRYAFNIVSESTVCDGWTVRSAMNNTLFAVSTPKSSGRRFSKIFILKVGGSLLRS